MSNSNSFDNVLTSLIIEAQQADADTLRMTVFAKRGRASVHGCAYFSRSSLINKVKDFLLFPIPRDKIPHIEGGFYSEADDHLAEIHMSIELFPIDYIGNFILRIRAFDPHEIDGFGSGGQVDFDIEYQQIDDIFKRLSGIVNDGYGILEYFDLKL